MKIINTEKGERGKKEEKRRKEKGSKKRGKHCLTTVILLE